jgi:hypothetical protein
LEGDNKSKQAVLMKYDARLDRSKHISPHFSPGGGVAMKCSGYNENAVNA